MRKVVPLMLLVQATLALAQPPSPFNGLAPEPVDSISGSHRILFSGHFYGSSHNRSGMPASTVLGNIDMLNAFDADMMLLTGDLFLDPANDAPRHQEVFYRKLKMPVYSAVGNHDVSGDYYEKHFGPTFMAFDRGPDRIIIIDTERDDSKLKEDQLALLADAALAAEAGQLRHVFIVGHRPIWAEANEKLGSLFKQNTRSMFGTNFDKEVKPLLERIRKHATVYWLGGSIGGGAPASVFFHQEADGLFYIQSAIRDEPRDAVLLAEVDDAGVRWTVHSLTGKEVLDAEELDVSHWSRFAGRKEAFNWRLLPYLALNTVTDRAFWIGGVVALLLAGLLRRLARRGW